jgi:DNA-binding transcriptional regulator YiaG
MRDLNDGELIGSMREALGHAQGKPTLETTKAPRRTRTMFPAAIVRIRRWLEASIPAFAACPNVTPDTVRGWQKNRRQPSGPARRLRRIAEKKPEILLASA